MEELIEAIPDTHHEPLILLFLTILLVQVIIEFLSKIIVHGILPSVVSMIRNRYV